MASHDAPIEVDPTTQKPVAYVWPGGYPVYYLSEQGNVLCAECAGRATDNDLVVACDANWEDASLYCDDCSARIESAYGEDDVLDDSDDEPEGD